MDLEDPQDVLEAFVSGRALGDGGACTTIGKLTTPGEVAGAVKKGMPAVRVTVLAAALMSFAKSAAFKMCEPGAY